jgi:hypothetical protein
MAAAAPAVDPAKTMATIKSPTSIRAREQEYHSHSSSNQNVHMRFHSLKGSSRPSRRRPRRQVLANGSNAEERQCSKLRVAALDLIAQGNRLESSVSGFMNAMSAKL